MICFIDFLLFIGAELFAKRRKRSEKWVVAETNGARQTPIPDIEPTPVPLLSPLPPISSFPPPSYLPETAQRIQHKEKLDEIQVSRILIVGIVITFFSILLSSKTLNLVFF